MIAKKRAALGLALLSTLAVLPLSATVFAPRVFAKSAPSSAESELRAIYKKVEQAYLRRDANAIIALETPDFKNKKWKGRVLSRAQSDASLRRFLKRVTSIDAVNFVILDVKTLGNKAIVSSRTKAAATLHASNQRVTHFRVFAQGRDTWLKTPGGWRIQFGDTQSKKTFINGRSIN